MVAYSSTPAAGSVGSLIDRIYRSWLWHPDDQPTRFHLDGAITAGSTSFVFDGTFLSAEELELLGPGTVIEIDNELIVCGNVDESTNTVTAIGRGLHGTTPAAHSDGVECLIAPTWPRIAIFEAIADTIVSLWPDLYTISQTGLLNLSDFTYTEVPATVEKPLFFWRASTSTASDWRKLQVQFYDQFPPSSTGKAIQVPGGGSGYLVYRGKFVRPTTEADDLQDDIGIDQEWERLVEVATVAHLVAGRDVERLTLEHLSEQLESQGVPIQSPGRVRDALIRYEGFLRDRARAALRSRYPTPMERNGLVSG